MKNIFIRILKKYCNIDVNEIQLQNQILLAKNVSLEKNKNTLIEQIGIISQRAVALEEEKDNIVRELQEKRQILKSVDENNNLKVSDEQIQDQIESLSRQYQILKEQYDSLYKENMNYKARICAKDATIDILNKDIIELKNENFRLKKIVPIVVRGTENDVYETENTSSGLTPTDINEIAQRTLTNNPGILGHLVGSVGTIFGRNKGENNRNGRNE